tara:strand:- start:42622 stop:43203 length:582 start_codon:yes stop_codon:yes gene_type:complete
VDYRKILFKFRSYTPLPIVVPLIYFSFLKSPYYWIGLIFIFIGEFIRFLSVRYAGGVTRTRKVGAPKLCTSGPYAYTRNPLYVGNVIIYFGFVYFSGGNYMLELSLGVLIFFLFQYANIISLEEETLTQLFGKDYDEYKENVPRIFPRITKWENYDDRIPNTLGKTFFNERRTLQNIFILISIILIKTYFTSS